MTQVAAPGGGGCHDWTDARYWQVYQPDIQGSPGAVQGGAFDGRYVYFYGLTVVNRYDTRAAFDDPGAWASADVSSFLQQRGDAYGLSGAVFDGRYLYLVPRAATALRYDTRGGFGDSQSWEAVSLTSLYADVAGGYGGGTFDGRYVYFFPAFGVDDPANPVPKATPPPVRFDTTRGFADPGAWQFTSASPISAVGGTIQVGAGGLFDGRYVYYVANREDYASLRSPSDAPTTRYDTTLAFDDPNAWALAPRAPVGLHYPYVLLLDGVAGAYDGRFVYVLGYSEGGIVLSPARIDPNVDFTQVQSWATAAPGVPSWTIATSDAGNSSPGLDDNGNTTDYNFTGAAFDGCFLYFLCANGPSWRYDPRGNFASTPPSPFNLQQLTPGSVNFNSPVFDGRYLYIPNSNGQFLRFDAHEPPRALPPWSAGGAFASLSLLL